MCAFFCFLEIWETFIDLEPVRCAQEQDTVPPLKLIYLASRCWNGDNGKRWKWDTVTHYVTDTQMLPLMVWGPQCWEGSGYRGGGGRDTGLSQKSGKRWREDSRVRGSTVCMPECATGDILVTFGDVCSLFLYVGWVPISPMKTGP